MTDASTRLAYEIEEHAKTLAKSPDSSLTFLHSPKQRPEGCAGEYTITAQAGGALAVKCVERTHAYTTTYHRRFVVVPKPLSVSHSRGEPARITLRKAGTQIELTTLE